MSGRIVGLAVALSLTGMLVGSVSSLYWHSKSVSRPGDIAIGHGWPYHWIIRCTRPIDECLARNEMDEFYFPVGRATAFDQLQLVLTAGFWFLVSAAVVVIPLGTLALSRRLMNQRSEDESSRFT